MSMSKNRTSLLRRTWQSVLAAILLAMPAVPAVAQSIPDFSGMWENRDEYFKPPESGPGPVMSLPAVRGVLYHADYNNPILQPWVREILKKNQETDKDGLQPSPAAISSCWPGSIPGVMAIRNVFKILQTPKLVVMVFTNNHQVRFVHLDQPHSKNVPLTWFGESVGHYEGDSLVVDTVGLAAKRMSLLDVFGTPHTDALHVTERFRLVDGGKTLRDEIHIEDPGAFTTPFNAVQIYTKAQATGVAGIFEEKVCAENNRSVGLVAMPTAVKPDF
jgi:hypothetical protein